MRIIFCELKKIWRLRTICIIAIFCLLYYLAFMHSYIVHYPDGHPAAEDIYLATELTERYGAIITPAEFAEFMQIRDTLTLEADRLIAQNPVLAEMGITDYKSLRETIMTLSNDDSDDAKAKQLAILEAYYDQTGGEPQTAYMLNSLDDMANLYEKCLDIEGVTTSAIYVTTIDNTVNYMKSLAVLLVIVTLVCASPLVTTDRIRKMNQLQYSSKQGRKIVWKQFAATLLSSAALTTVLIFVFGTIYAQNDTQAFWNSYVSSFFSFTVLTSPLTFGQYVLTMAVMLYLLGLTVSAIVFVLSRFCGNYIALSAGLVPVFVSAYIECGNILFNSPLQNKGHGGVMYEPKVCAALLLLGLAAACAVMLRERRVDV